MDVAPTKQATTKQATPDIKVTFDDKGKVEYSAKLYDGYAVIIAPFQKPRMSSSGSTVLHFTTGGADWMTFTNGWGLSLNIMSKPEEKGVLPTF